MQKRGAELIPDGSRAHILNAAAICFMERGYTETSIDDVARRLGSTKGRVYHHFPSKGDLFAAIFRAGMEMDYAAIASARAHQGAAIERLRLMAKAHVRQIIVSLPFQRVVWQGVQMHLRGATTPEQRQALADLIADRDAYDRIFRDTMLAAEQEGALMLPSLSLAASMMFVTLNSPIFWYRPRPGETEDDIDHMAGQIVGFAMRGLGSRED